MAATKEQVKSWIATKLASKIAVQLPEVPGKFNAFDLKPDEVLLEYYIDPSNGSRNIISIEVDKLADVLLPTFPDVALPDQALANAHFTNMKEANSGNGHAKYLQQWRDESLI